MRRREFIKVVAASTVAWPLAAYAQQPAMPVIGLLDPVPAAEAMPVLAAFLRGLTEAGYVEGKNLAIEYRFTNFKPELMQQAASDVVRRKVNVIFAATPEAGAAARNATTSIPIVGVDLESDPLAMGYVKSLARPGGNFTGMFLDLPELSGKQIGLLKEIVPQLSHIAVFGIPGLNAAQFAATAAAVKTAAVELKLLKWRSRMTGGVLWRPPRQSKSKPVFCCRRLSSGTLQSKSASWRWLIGCLSFPCSPNFQKPAVSLLMGRT
jgi:putative ABC transport system substrate-binding protein